jgi:endonuclease/exonuclease/phosphatase family metal-dependent hydrolase
MKKILVLFMFIAVTAEAFEFNVATMNIRFYGQGAEISGSLKDEFRDKWIIEFIRKELTNNDAIMFQEIVDIKRFSKLADKLNMSCFAYDGSTNKGSYRHQHVVFCLNNKYDFKRLPQLDGYAYWPVADAYRIRLRPAVVGIVIDKKSKKELFTIAGLHLKARDTHSQTRMNQVNELITLIKKNKNLPPFVVLGDFNTHSAQETGRRSSDLTYLKYAFAKVDMEWARHYQENTFRLPEVSFQFDHIFTQSGIRAYSTKVKGPCNNKERGDRFQDFQFYNRFISDHCPVSTRLHGQ